VRGCDDRAGRPADLGRDIDSATGLAFRPDGARLAVAGLSSMYVLDVARRRSVASVDLATAADSGIAFSPDGSLLAFASSEGVGVFDGTLSLQVRLAQLEPFTSADHVAFSPDGRWVAAGLAGAQPTLQVWPSLASGTAVTLESGGVTYGPQPPAFSSDSQWLASFSQGRSLMIWATATWAVERTWTLPGTGRALAFAPEGSRLAVAGDGEAAIWDADTSRKLVTLSTPGSTEATEIAWSPDGSRIVSSADDGVLRFWNASDGRLLASLFTLASSGDWLLVAPDGRLDGSKHALTRLVAWRSGDRVTNDKELTDLHRVRRLWRALSPSTLSRQ
jgi:WD40 repeat protein